MWAVTLIFGSLSWQLDRTILSCFLYASVLTHPCSAVINATKMLKFSGTRLSRAPAWSKSRSGKGSGGCRETTLSRDYPFLHANAGKNRQIQGHTKKGNTSATRKPLFSRTLGLPRGCRGVHFSEGARFQTYAPSVTANGMDRPALCGSTATEVTPIRVPSAALREGITVQDANLSSSTADDQVYDEDQHSKKGTSCPFEDSCRTADEFPRQRNTLRNRSQLVSIPENQACSEASCGYFDTLPATRDSSPQNESFVIAPGHIISKSDCPSECGDSSPQKDPLVMACGDSTAHNSSLSAWGDSSRHSDTTQAGETDERTSDDGIKGAVAGFFVCTAHNGSVVAQGDSSIHGNAKQARKNSDSGTESTHIQPIAGTTVVAAVLQSSVQSDALVVPCGYSIAHNGSLAAQGDSSHHSDTWQAGEANEHTSDDGTGGFRTQAGAAATVAHIAAVGMGLRPGEDAAADIEQYSTTGIHQGETSGLEGGKAADIHQDCAARIEQGNLISATGNCASDEITAASNTGSCKADVNGTMCVSGEFNCEGTEPASNCDHSEREGWQQKDALQHEIVHQDPSTCSAALHTDCLESNRDAQAAETIDGSSDDGVLEDTARNVSERELAASSKVGEVEAADGDHSKNMHGVLC